MPRPRPRIGYVLLALGLGMLLGATWIAINDLRAGEVLRLQKPWALLLLGGPVLVTWVSLHLDLRRRATLWLSSGLPLLKVEAGLVTRLTSLPGVMRIAALTMIVIALARPQTYVNEARTVEGIDIMLVLDLSKSMEEKDLSRSRLDAGQRTLREFLRARAGLGDRVGLVVFAKEAMLQCPMTLDYRSLESIIASLEIGDVPELGTAIGDALGLALASLRRSESESKVIILLSDGDWNRAEYMDPDEARALSVDMGVRVFTVLLGQEQQGNTNALRSKQYAVNADLLKDLAADTQGSFFAVKDDQSLASSFEEIRKALKTSEHRVMGKAPSLEFYDLLLWPAFILLLLELLLRMTRFRSFP